MEKATQTGVGPHAKVLDLLVEMGNVSLQLCRRSDLIGDRACISFGLVRHQQLAGLFQLHPSVGDRRL